MQVHAGTCTLRFLTENAANRQTKAEAETPLGAEAGRSSWWGRLFSPNWHIVQIAAIQSFHQEFLERMKARFPAGDHRFEPAKKGAKQISTQ